MNSARHEGAVGKNAIVPRLVAALHPKGKVLDYGSGKMAIHTTMLRKKGINVTAHELPDNQVDKRHDLHALRRKYDIVFASNVINVQEDLDSLRKVFKELSLATKINGMCLLNYPTSPRYIGLTDRAVYEMIHAYFFYVVILNDKIWGDVGSNVVFLCAIPFV